MQFYTLFDKIPKLPADLVMEIRSCVQPDNLTRVGPKDKKVPMLIDYSLPNDHTVNAITYHRFDVTRRVMDWVAENIHQELTQALQVGVQQFAHKLPGKPVTSGPHVDGPRGDYVLNYCLEPGGDHVLTQWFQQEGYPVIREGAHRTGLYLKTFDGLTKIHEVKCPVEQWHGLEIRALHTVANLTSSRLALSIGVPQAILPDIIKRYS